MTYIEAMEALERGLAEWRSKPHNKRWWRLIDGTPIPNDLLVCMAMELSKRDREAWARDQQNI
jgi:hypothetical protein